MTVKRQFVVAVAIIVAAGSMTRSGAAQQLKAGEVEDSGSKAVPAPTGAAASDLEISKASAATAKKPASDDAWVRLGDAFMQKARETADSGYYTRAEGAYRKALARNPKSLDAMAGMAWVNGGRHEFETSIDWAKKVLAIDPKYTAAYGMIGDADVEMGDYDDAYERYQKMLDLHPDLSAYGRSGHLLQLMGDSKKGSWFMMKAIKAGSPYAENTAWCRSQLALTLFAQGAYVPAEQVLEEGLRQLSGDYRLLAAMGKVKAARKDYDAAIDYYKRAIAIAPQQELVAALGDLYQLTGKPEEAAKQYALMETIARLNKANGVQGDMLTAKFYADHDRNLDEALRLAQAEYKTRKNVYAADTLAWCYFKKGQLDEARKYIRNALQYKTPEALFYFHKGMIYAKSGDRRVAQNSLYQAMSLSPNFDPIQAQTAEKTMAELGSVSTSPESGTAAGSLP